MDDAAQRGQNTIVRAVHKPICQILREDAEAKAGQEIDKGNQDLRKAIDEYGNGNADSAQTNYDKALEHYDQALDLLGD